jgi:3-carboxy-cis,cis-muconate cycloisomerase
MIDTALVLELRAVIDALLVDLDRATKGFTVLVGRHRRNLGVARTLMQHALPMPFGLKLAGYAAALSRSRDRLRRLRKEALALQFGGAAGTLAALGEQGLNVSERLAALLDLPQPDAPWHSHRDRLAEIASTLAILAGTCGKIARDVALLMQTEVGEAFEPSAPGRGGSSTLPHKRNPTAVSAALSAAMLAPQFAGTILAAQIQEHERSVGVWGVEWTTFPALALVTSGALATIADISEGLEVDVERLKANLEQSSGLVMAECVSFALAEKIGKSEAHAILQELAQEAAKSSRPFRELVESDARVTAHIPTIELGKLFMPTSYQGSAQTFIDRLVASAQGRTTVRRSIDLLMEAKPISLKTAREAPSAAAPVAAKPAPTPVTAPAHAAAVEPVAIEKPVPVEPATVEPAPVEPVAAVPVPAPAALAEVPPAEAPTVIAPPAEPAKPSVDEPSALMEAFSRVAEATEQLNASKDPDNERKAG